MESGVFQREAGEEREQGAGPEERDWAADDAAPSSSQWSPGMGRVTDLTTGVVVCSRTWVVI